jgi:hypothetical protein
MPKSEVVEELPTGLGIGDRGYKCWVGDAAYAWNGETWCRIYEHIHELPSNPTDGLRCYVGDSEIVFDALTGWHPVESDDSPDMVNHPAHYQGPPIRAWAHGAWQPGTRPIECIEVARHITDGRLFSAFCYVWRVAFGGKHNNEEDIKKAIWYLKDYLDNKIGNE